MKALASCIINDWNYLSAVRIAEELKRDQTSIYRFIKRRNIQPALTLNGFHYYTRATLGKIAKGMRRKNGCNGNKA
jgi:hypothetical protein